MIDLTARALEINDCLEKMMPAESPSYGKINEAMRYSVLGGGKRLRGIMLMEAFRLYSSDEDMAQLLALPYAAAIECVHAYSLVHDDLPSMDNDMYRRGNLTTHAKYGHAMGVLTGDALLNYAFELISKAQSSLSVYRNSEYICEMYGRTSHAASLIFGKSGFDGMVGGQVLDVCEDYSGDPTDIYARIRYLMKLYELKTSRLFEASLCAGAVLAGADPAQVRLLEQLGYTIGVAFQIRDDILDIISTREQLGKDTGADKKNGKPTVPSLVGLAKAEELVGKMSEDAIEIADKLEGNTEFLKELTRYLISRDK